MQLQAGHQISEIGAALTRHGCPCQNAMHTTDNVGHHHTQAGTVTSSMHGVLSLAHHQGLQSFAQHDHMPLPTLHPVIGVVKTVLPPDPPSARTIAAQRDTAQVYCLVQQLEVLSQAGPSNRLYGQFPDTHSSQEVQADSAEQKKYKHFTQC